MPGIQKIIAFFQNALLLFRLKERSSKAPSLVSQSPGWRIISTNLPAFSILGDEALTE
jgi:hypothetical protein